MLVQTSGITAAKEGGQVLSAPSHVSVVIPTFNRGSVVVEAIESVLAQTVPSLEIIVVDDGSTDDTRDRLAPYLDHIVYLRQDNQGVSAARNTGIRAARGELIAFLDSDDVWHPRKLELQLQYLHDYPETALVGTSSFNDSTRHWPALPNTASNRAKRLVLEDVALRTPFPTSTVVVRKDCFDAIGYFDTGLRNAEDRDMYIRIRSRFPMSKLGIVLVWSRRDGEHLSDESVTGEESTRKMILGVFNRIDSLPGRFFLRRQALSQAAFEASRGYQAKGKRVLALSRIIRSFILWPLPYRRDESARSFARIRTLIVCLLRILHLKA